MDQVIYLEIRKAFFGYAVPVFGGTARVIMIFGVFFVMVSSASARLEMKEVLFLHHILLDCSEFTQQLDRLACGSYFSATKGEPVL
ncbi:hypothetical protein F5Y12DRAFT_712191 [Xylaria sp. FL1777]|nr:hypothetical protein F5Y12DRAFT_712191 [Xylaria sp. FL1777]